MMRLYYIDDSGDRKRDTNPENPYFALGGFGIDVEEASDLKVRVAKIAQAFGLNLKHPIELKLNNLFRNDSEKKPNWMHRFGLDRETRRALALACLRELADTPTVSVIVVAVNRPQIYENAASPIYHALDCLLERVQFDCEEHESTGMIVCDEERSHDESLRARMRTAPLYTELGRLVDTISFMPSTESVGLQLADFVSGSVTRCLNRKDPGLLRVLWPAFRSKYDVVLGYGLKFFPNIEPLTIPAMPKPWPNRERKLLEIECSKLGKALSWQADGTPLIDGLPYGTRKKTEAS